MTEDFKNWWGVFGISSVLILLAMVEGVSQPIRLVLWLMTLGLSSNLFYYIDKFLPAINLTDSFDPSAPPIAFYYRDPWLSININPLFFDSFSVQISKDKYVGNFTWERWGWATRRDGK